MGKPRTAPKSNDQGSVDMNFAYSDSEKLEKNSNMADMEKVNLEADKMAAETQVICWLTTMGM